MQIAGIILTILGALPGLGFLFSVLMIGWSTFSGGFVGALANYGLISAIMFPGFAMLAAGVLLLVFSRRNKAARS